MTANEPAVGTFGPILDYHQHQEYSPPGGCSPTAQWIVALPKAIQRVAAAATGYWPPGLHPATGSNWLTHVARASAMVVFGIAGAVVLLHKLPSTVAFGTIGEALVTCAFALPLWGLAMAYCWLITVGGMRRYQVDIVHFGVHGDLGPNAFWTRFIVELSTASLLLQNFEDYYNEHVGIHHSRRCATGDDPDLRLLRSLGFHPGQSVATLWHVFLCNLTSVSFHGIMLWGRIKNNFARGSAWRRFAALVLQCLPLTICLIKGWMFEYLVAWALPATLLYHASALAQFTSEHRWLLVKSPDVSPRFHIARLTLGRFLGEAPPTKTGWKQVSSLMVWMLRMVLIHLPSRIAVIVGTLPAHDHHHRRSVGKRWVDGLYLRRADIDAGCPGWPVQYSEVWGLVPAIHGFFVYFSKLPVQPDGSSSTTGQASDDLSAM